MRKCEGRSFTPPPPPPPRPNPGRTGRKGWMRPDVPRPVAPVRMPISSTEPMVEEPEEADAVDIFGLLSVEARRDVLATSLGSITGIAL